MRPARGASLLPRPRAGQARGAHLSASTNRNAKCICVLGPDRDFDAEGVCVLDSERHRLHRRARFGMLRTGRVYVRLKQASVRSTGMPLLGSMRLLLTTPLSKRPEQRLVQR